MNARPSLAGTAATGDKALAHAAVIDQMLRELSATTGSRLQDYSEKTQAATSDEDLAEAFCMESDEIFHAVDHGTATPLQKLLHEFCERVMCTSFQIYEARQLREQHHD